MAIRDLKNPAEAAQILRLLRVCYAHGIDVQVQTAGGADSDPAPGPVEAIAEGPITNLIFYSAADRRPLGGMTLEHGLGADRHVAAASANATIMDMLTRSDIEPHPALICASSEKDQSYFQSHHAIAAFAKFTHDEAHHAVYTALNLIQSAIMPLRTLEKFIDSTLDMAIATQSGLTVGAQDYIVKSTDAMTLEAMALIDDVSEAVSKAAAAMAAIQPIPDEEEDGGSNDA